MAIYLENMSEEELIALNRQIIERLKEIRTQKSMQQAAQFRIGDIVSFAHEGNKIQGIIIKINQRSLSVLTADNIKWNLSPSLVMKEKRPSEKIKVLLADFFPFFELTRKMK